MNNATPGPWHVWDRGIGWEVHAGATCSDQCDSLNDGFRGTFSESDANLIAAAPDLLAACRAAQMFIRNGVEMGYICLPTMPSDPALKTPALIEGAIAKAEGRNNG